MRPRSGRSSTRGLCPFVAMRTSPVTVLSGGLGNTTAGHGPLSPPASAGAGEPGLHAQSRAMAQSGCAVESSAMALREDLLRQRTAIRQIAARHGASNLRVFGSVARGEERPDSDVDLLIDL